MIDDNIDKLLTDYTEIFGEEKLCNLLAQEILKFKDYKEYLTILVNSGSHRIPGRYIRGELFIASSGNLDFSNQDIIVSQYKDILVNLREKLVEKEWKRVYLIPTGHVTLSLQIKSLVYHVLRIDTIDLFYSQGDYYEVEISHRSL